LQEFYSLSITLQGKKPDIDVGFGNVVAVYDEPIIASPHFVLASVGSSSFLPAPLTAFNQISCWPLRVERNPWFTPPVPRLQ
jgi:hypothetical protein